MTEQKLTERLESQLYELYTIPEPDSAFTRLLRSQILERAERRRTNWTATLWSGLTSAGHTAFSLGGAVLLLALVIVGANLLITRFNPHQGGSLAPAAGRLSTPTATLVSAQAIFKPPQLAPSACDTLITPQPSNAAHNRPGKLLGGGVVKSGDFQINLYLFCDPSFRPDNNETYSEITGLGIYQSMWYNGPDIEEPEMMTMIYQNGQPVTEKIPAVSLQRGIKASQKTGLFFDPSTIPDWYAPELPMRYLYTIPGERGKTYGAALSFRLVKGRDGFTVHDVSVQALNEAEMVQKNLLSGFMPIFPTVQPESMHPLLGELKTIQKLQRAWLYSGSGWYLQRMQWEIIGDPFGNSSPQDRPRSEYVFAKEFLSDYWYEVNENGTLTRTVNRQSRADERYGEMILREERYVLPTPGLQEESFAEPPVFDEGAFNYGVEAIRRGGTITKQELAGTVQFTITTNAHETQTVFDPQTGELLEVRNYTIHKDGQKTLYSTGKTVILERVDNPPQDILNLFKR